MRILHYYTASDKISHEYIDILSKAMTELNYLSGDGCIENVSASSLHEALKLINLSNVDIIHLHGCWRDSDFMLVRKAKKSGTRIIVSPHGQLEPWVINTDYWKKHFPRIIVYQKKIGRDAFAVVVMGRMEEECMKRLGWNVRIEVVKNSTGINNQQGSINYILNNTVELPQFTGTASFGNLNSSGAFVSGNSINYTSNTPQSQISALSVRLSTVGDSTVNNSQFIIMIPKGFTSSVNDFYLIDKDVGNYFGGVFNGSNQYSTSNYSIEDLGKVGPYGEQLFKIQLDFNPVWNAAQNFGGQFKLTLDQSSRERRTTYYCLYHK